MSMACQARISHGEPVPKASADTTQNMPLLFLDLGPLCARQNKGRKGRRQGKGTVGYGGTVIVALHH